MKPALHKAVLPTERGRLASFLGLCAQGELWLGRALRGGLPVLASLGLAGTTGNRRLAVRYHDGQMKQQRVRSNLPSGLLLGQRRRDKLRLYTSFNSLDESPEGIAWHWPGRGKSPLVSSAFSIHSGGMVSREGDDAKSPQLWVSPPCLCVVASSKEVYKTALGCLTYSRVWWLSRGKYNLW